MCSLVIPIVIENAPLMQAQKQGKKKTLKCLEEHILVTLNIRQIIQLKSLHTTLHFTQHFSSWRTQRSFHMGVVAATQAQQKSLKMCKFNPNKASKQKHKLECENKGGVQRTNTL